MAPTIVDKTINRFGKPLLITFTSLVVISAAITIFSPGLITNPGEFCCNKAHRRRRAKSIQYPEFEGEPRDWTNEQLLEWLEAVCTKFFFASLDRLTLGSYIGFVSCSVLAACLICFFFVSARIAACRLGLMRDEIIWDPHATMFDKCAVTQLIH